jgi:phospholipase D1/2
MEEKSGVKFHSAQVALSRQWLGDINDKKGVFVPTEVEVKVPLETNEALLVTSEATVKTEKVPLPRDEHEAREIIERFESAGHDSDLQSAHNVSDNVVQHMMTDTTGLDQEQWMGTEEEELAA